MPRCSLARSLARSVGRSPPSLPLAIAAAAAAAADAATNDLSRPFFFASYTTPPPRARTRSRTYVYVLRTPNGQLRPAAGIYMLPGWLARRRDVHLGFKMLDRRHSFCLSVLSSPPFRDFTAPRYSAARAYDEEE